jgi:hypothetical protein
MYQLMCIFFFICHTHTLASDTQLGQPDWRKNGINLAKRISGYLWWLMAKNRDFLGIERYLK